MSCHREHEKGLHFAREAGRPDLEAASLGGLGDAEYVCGRMARARRRLGECVELAARQGLGRIEVANKAQIAHAMLFDGSQAEAYDAARAAVQGAERVGHSRAEINARAAVVKALLSLGRYEECLEEITLFEGCIEKLGAVRFRQVAYMHRGPSLHALGRTKEAVAVLEEGIAFARSTGFAFHGPSIVSALAVLVDDRARRRALIDDALTACLTGCVGHNQFRVYADGIDVAYGLRDVALLKQFITLTAEFPEGEQLAWSNFHAMRGRALLGRLLHGDVPEVREANDIVDETGQRALYATLASGITSRTFEHQCLTAQYAGLTASRPLVGYAPLARRLDDRILPEFAALHMSPAGRFCCRSRPRVCIRPG